MEFQILFPFQEHVLQVLPGEGPVISPGLGEGPVEKGAVHQKDEQGDQHGQREQGPLHPLGDRKGI